MATVAKLDTLSLCKGFTAPQPTGEEEALQKEKLKRKNQMEALVSFSMTLNVSTRENAELEGENHLDWLVPGLSFLLVMKTEILKDS